MLYKTQQFNRRCMYRIKMFNAFADKDENSELPGSDWDYTFSEQDGKTRISITIHNESLARMEKMIEMGFTEGFKLDRL